MKCVFLILLLAPCFAHADLYRWVDPGTGKVKFSSYPPPWFGDAQRERGAPAVEVIPSRAAPAPVKAAPAPAKAAPAPVKPQK